MANHRTRDSVAGDRQLRPDHPRTGFDSARTAASLAISVLRAWPVERWPHRVLLARAFALLDNVRGYDALYIALAEALDATLLILDHRLASAAVRRVYCRVQIAQTHDGVDH